MVANTMNTKYSYKKTMRVNGHIKSIIEKNCRDVRYKTGLELSYGKIARAFWSTLAEDPKLRKKCMDLVCKAILRDINKKTEECYNGK